MRVQIGVAKGHAIELQMSAHGIHLMSLPLREQLSLTVKGTPRMG